MANKEVGEDWNNFNNFNKKNDSLSLKVINMRLDFQMC